MISLYPQSKKFKNNKIPQRRRKNKSQRILERIVSTFYSNHKKIIYIRIKYQVSSTGKENCSTCHFKLLPVMFLFLLLPWDVNVLKKYVCTLKIFPEVSGFHMFLGKQIIHSVGHSWWHLDLLISTFRPYYFVFQNSLTCGPT